MGYENCGKHPNSLAQLRPVMDSETAREMQARGAEKRRQNKALREAMRLSASEFKKIRDEVIEIYKVDNSIPMLDNNNKCTVVI